MPRCVVSSRSFGWTSLVQQAGGGPFPPAHTPCLPEIAHGEGAWPVTLRPEAVHNYFWRFFADSKPLPLPASHLPLVAVLRLELRSTSRSSERHPPWLPTDKSPPTAADRKSPPAPAPPPAATHPLPTPPRA